MVRSCVCSGLRASTLLLVAVTLCLAAPVDASEELVLGDRVEAVTLYSNQALVTRTASAQLSAGRNRLAFTALPSAVDESSIRVLTSGGRLLGFEVVRGYGEAELPPELRSKRDRIEAIDRELAIIDGTRAALTAEISMLTNLPPGSPPTRDDGTVPDLDPTTMRRFLDWSAGRLTSAGDRLTDLDLQRVGLVEEREALVSDLLGTQGESAALNRPRVVADVEVEVASKADLTLVYRTYDARWVPSYDIRLSTGSGAMDLGLNALVWQQTAEDWQDVELELSTAVPTHSASLPTLLAWFIEETPPPPPPPPQMADSTPRDQRSRRSSRGAKSAPAPMASAEMVAEPMPSADYDYGYAEDKEWEAPPREPGLLLDGRSQDAPARVSLTDGLRNDAGARAYLQDRSWPLLDTSSRHSVLVGAVAFDPVGGRELVAVPPVSDGYESSVAGWGAYAPSSNAMGFDFAFSANEPVTVASDGLVHKVPLVTHSFTSRIEHVVVPAVEQAAFLQAVVDNGSPYPMLAGMSNVFLDGCYLGRLPTRTVAPGQPLELALGIDRSVKVERRQEQLSDKGGVFGNQKVRAYQVTVHLENYRERAVRVRVLDRVAHTYDEEIKLTLDERSHEPDEDLGQGMLEWRLDVASGDRETLTFGYTLKHNKNYRVWHP